MNKNNRKGVDSKILGEQLLEQKEELIKLLTEIKKEQASNLKNKQP